MAVCHELERPISNLRAPAATPAYLANLTAEDAIAVYRYLNNVADQDPVNHHAEATRSAAVEFLIMARELRRRPSANVDLASVWPQPRSPVE